MRLPKFVDKRNGFRTALYISVAIVGMLLVFLVVFYFLTEKNGGSKGNEIVENTPTPTATPTTIMLAQNTPTPVATDTPVPTNTPTGVPTKAPTNTPTGVPTKAPTNTPTSIPTKAPTSTPTSVPTKATTGTPTKTPEIQPSPYPYYCEVKGLDLIPEIVSKTVSEIAKEYAANFKAWSTEKEMPYVQVTYYAYPAYVSIIVSCCDNGGIVKMDPHVYDMETGKQLSVTEVFDETYLAIIKERLQTTVLTIDKAFEKTSFVTYDEPYNVKDYEKFYLNDDMVTFLFDEDSLIDKKHAEFSYDVTLNEARAFMKKDIDGNYVGSPIRKDLNSNGKMVAFTYNAGPYEPVESLLLQTFEKYNARGTFFFNGSRIAQYSLCRQSAQALAEAGNQIASYTYSSATGFNSNSCDKEKYWTEINRNNEILAKTVGYAPELLRMPGGCDGMKFMQSCPMPMINWTFDTKDWNGGTTKATNVGTDTYNAKVKEIYDFIMKADAAGTLDGSIVLMNSIYFQSADATEMLMEALSKKGYQFVTVSELMYYRGITLENGRTTYSTKGTANINRIPSK